MNTITRNRVNESDFEDGVMLIEDYRYYQHQIIDYFLQICVNYIANKNENYIKFDKVVVENVFTYFGISQNELLKYIVYIENGRTKEVKPFFQIYVPKLIENNYYILNGNNYVPLLYLTDKPIIIKENSVNLSSLFNSITLMYKDNICNFGGRGFLLTNFVELFLRNNVDDERNNLIRKKLNIDTSISDKNLIKYFDNVFDKNFDNINNLILFIEDFFFDDYTKYLFANCYFSGEIQEVRLDEIIKFATIRFFENKPFNFIDLNNKRLVLMELLLAPLFQKTMAAAYQGNKGFRNDELKIDHYVIIKNFLKSQDGKSKSPKADVVGFRGLSGKSLYDTVNLYSSILLHKATFIKPGMSHPPKCVSDIDGTHFGRLCPITVSSSDPGETVSIVAETKVDIFGQFVGLGGGKDGKSNL